MTGPLEGIKVIDLTQVLFGPFTTMLLSDMGAEVIKIERPEVGDIARGNGPFVNGLSTYFSSLNRGKQSLTLDITQENGRKILFKLAGQADIFIETYTPKTVSELGIGYDEVKKYNPGIIYAAGSGFGMDAPDKYKPAFDVIIQAMGGAMSITGEENGEPIRPGVSYGDITAALFMCIAILAALNEHNRTGHGQFIDLSMLDCQVAVLENAFVRYFNTGEIPRPLGTRHPVMTPFQLFKTRDSYIAVALRGGIKNQWPLFCAAIDRVDLIDDPRFIDGELRTRNYKILEPIFTPVMQTKTTADWMREFEQLGIPCGPYNDIPHAAEDRNLRHRNMFVDIEDTQGRKLKVVNTPFNFALTPGSSKRGAPELGEHTELLLKRILGLSPEEITQLRAAKII